MVPIRDSNPRDTTPWVNYLLIALNLGVWFLELSLMSTGAAWLTAGYGLVPTRITSDPPGEAFTIFTSMFMHGSWAHVGGNMLFLYIFGDNVEDAVGHLRYTLFYLVCGIGAALTQILVGPGSQVPMVGASGAIAGVLGAYLVLYPRAPITVINPIFPLWFLFGLLLEFPAWLVVGEWFAWNLLGGFGSAGADQAGGVAFFAHIGGFIGGLLLVRPLMLGRRRKQPQRWQGWRLPPHGRGPYGPPPPGTPHSGVGRRGGLPW